MILSDRVEVLRATTTEDALGNFVADWANATATLSPAAVSPLKAEEYTAGRQSTTTYYRVVLPRAVDVLATDRVRWRGTDYDVEGQAEQHSLTGRLHHQEAVMRAFG